MSGDGSKMDPARGWYFVEGLLVEDELARLEKLGEKELDEELRGVGIDPARVPTAERLVAKAEERARTRKVDPARGWKFVEKLLDEEKPRPVPSAEDLVARAAAKARAREKERGQEEKKLASAPPEVARARPAEGEKPERAPEVRGETRRPRRAAVYVAALIAAAVLLFLMMNSAAIVAYFKGEEIKPDDQWLPWRPAPTPEERAAVVRKDAFAACDEARWVACQAKLDEAAGLDPAGESAPRVAEARKAIARASVTDGGDGTKPRAP